MAINWTRTLAIAVIAILGTLSPVEAQSPPGITVRDQEVRNGAVVLERVVSPEDAWVDVHSEAGIAGNAGPAIGHAEVKAGENTNVVVPIEVAKATPVLYAVLHTDRGVPGVFESPNGPDAPFTINGRVIEVSFTAFLRTSGNTTAAGAQQPGVATAASAPTQAPTQSAAAPTAAPTAATVATGATMAVTTTATAVATTATAIPAATGAIATAQPRSATAASAASNPSQVVLPERLPSTGSGPALGSPLALLASSVLLALAGIVLRFRRGRRQ